MAPDVPARFAKGQPALDGVHKDVGHVDIRGVVDTFEDGFAQRHIFVLVSLVYLFTLVGVIDNVPGVAVVMTSAKGSVDVKIEHLERVLARFGRVTGYHGALPVDIPTTRQGKKKVNATRTYTFVE